MARPYTRKRPQNVDEERIRAAKLLYEHDFTQTLIAEMTGIDRVTLWRLVKKYEWVVRDVPAHETGS